MTKRCRWSALGAMDGDVEVAKRGGALLWQFYFLFIASVMDSVWIMWYALAVIAKEEL